MGSVFSRSPQGHLLRMKDRLEDMIESRFELIGVMSSCGALDYRQVQELQVFESVFKRNAELLNVMANTTNECFDKFLVALQNTGQTHVKNFILNKGERKPEDGDMRPLTRAELKIIYGYLDYCEDCLDTENGILNDLFQEQIISTQQRIHINHCSPTRRTSELINIVTRRSFADFKTFVNCLHKNGQHHVAKVFETSGIVVSYKVNVKGQSQGELNKLLAEIKLQLLSKGSPLAKKDLEIVHARAGCIELYFRCRTAEAEQDLQKMFDDHQLESFVKKWFASIQNSDETAVTISRPAAAGRVQRTERGKDTNEMMQRVTRTRRETDERELFVGDHFTAACKPSTCQVTQTVNIEDAVLDLPHSPLTPPLTTVATRQANPPPTSVGLFPGTPSAAPQCSSVLYSPVRPMVIGTDDYVWSLRRPSTPSSPPVGAGDEDQIRGIRFINRQGKTGLL